MKEISTSVRIDAPREAVWRTLLDFGRYPEWSRMIRALEGETRLGGPLRVTLELPGRRPATIRPTVCVIREYEEFGWRGHLGIPGLFSGEHTFRIERIDDRTSRLIHGERFAGVLVPIIWMMIGNSTEAGFRHFNAAIKSRAEAQI